MTNLAYHDLAYDDVGSGEPVLFIAGTGGVGRTWHIHQVPAFIGAGYRCITFDNRGVGATESDSGFTLEQMVNDTAELIERVAGGPVRIVSVSMGAFIAQELMLARPDLVTKAVLMGTRARIDKTRQLFRTAERELLESGIELPPAYSAKVRVLENFSPRTVNDENAIADWIDMFTAFPVRRTPGWYSQLNVYPRGNRVSAYRSIGADVLVIGFADDVITPPALGREVADSIPKGRYVQIANAGHLGFLERPDTINSAMLQFLSGTLI